MAYGELIDLNDHRPSLAQGGGQRRSGTPARRRMPVVVGIMVGSPISLMLWMVILFGLRGLF